MNHPIEQALKKIGISKKELVRRANTPPIVGMHHEALRRWLNGRALPDIKQAQALARELGVSTDELAEMLGGP